MSTAFEVIVCLLLIGIELSLGRFVGEYRVRTQVLVDIENHKRKKETE